MSPTVEERAARWADDLRGWAIPEEILAAAPSSPWAYETADFKVDSQRVVDTPSSRHEREVLPFGGTVLDVGCGGGRASLPLAPPATMVIGVDERVDMLRAFATDATARGVQVVTHAGRWPDVAPSVGRADVVVCHHVLYNVADIVPFLRALTAHAQLAVVVELTAEHPQTAWSDAWAHFWDLERPRAPTGEDLVGVVRSLGWSPEVWRHRRASSDDPFLDADRAVRSTLRRLCLPAERAEEVAGYLAVHPLRWPDVVLTLRWPGVEAR